ncbi:hypothetical protein MJO28_003486 [Puccinia striiformis f. sp. tritici]|uniref:Uncharacterized protein n=1 Tax=Puccinia striiformis f. sp. tritici TaxID=168172 RepID=A0ACC0ESV1_9BASI|nr:hypothetical protein MJO28_003486 [Puccinia striiformis f. sp. tritici]
MAYVLQLLPLGGDANCCAASSSSVGGPIKVFDLGRGGNHTPTIELQYPQATGRVSQLKSTIDHSLLIACFSSSSTLLAWDTRSANPKPTIQLTGHSSTPFLSLDYCPDSKLIAAGSSNEDESGLTQIELFDLRGTNNSPFCVYDQAHSDSITSLEFKPSSPDQLLSASTDGLIVLHNTTLADQDESILFTSNTGASVAHARWQPDGKTIWVGSDMETLSRWDADQLSLLNDYGDLRQDSLAKPDPSWEEPVAYLINLATPSPTRSAYFAGSQSGNVVLVDSTDPNSERWELLGSFKNGHTEMVRCASLEPQNGLVLTGGEDGRICVWSNQRGDQQSFQLVDHFNPFTETPLNNPQNHTTVKPDPNPQKNLSNKVNRFKPYDRQSH